MTGERIFGVLALGAITLFASCSQDRTSGAGASVNVDASVPTGATDSEAVRARVEDRRARFRMTPIAMAAAHRAPSASHAVIGAGVAAQFEMTRDGRLRAVVPKNAVAKSATVTLPTTARDAVEVADDASRVAVRFALQGASDATVRTADGIALYEHALNGADILHRAQAEGTEDFVVFEQQPAREELHYVVDVSRVMGLRFVANTIEFLDGAGIPRLRVAPPFVIDANGARHDATIALEGCAYDADPRGPWRRPITPPGAASCGIRIDWTGSGVVYPALVDPTWTATGSMGIARNGHSASVLLSGTVLVSGGASNGSYAGSAEIYDPTSGTFAATGSMSVARAIFTSSVLGSGKVLVAGGQNGGSGGYLSSADLYDPSTGTFTPTGSLGLGRTLHTANVLASGKVLIAAGYHGLTFLSASELYDPVAGTFSPTGSMVGGRISHSAGVLQSGKVLVAGGYGGADLSTAELYDPATGTFASTGTMLSAREHLTLSVLLSGKALVAGGSGGATLASAEIYDPALGTFAATGSMATPRDDYSATTLLSGEVLVAGGYNGTSNSSTAELYDPTLGMFVPTVPMAIARTEYTLSLLASGKVLAAGGYDGSSSQTNAAIFAAFAAGVACAGNGDCNSGLCNERCCTAACSGTCMTCDGTGACGAVQNADDPDTCTGATTCDATGACKKKIGQACPGGNGDCANAQCVDGYCCNAACTSGCDYCNLAGALGTCTVASAGDPGNASCSPDLCDGISAACPTTCVTDSQCVATHYCAANGTCTLRKSQAAACNVAAGADCKVASCRACGSGNCVDGVCCDTACNTTCQACTAALKQSGTLDGTCGPAKDNTNPHNDTCTTDPPSTCARNGMCNGGGGCRLAYPAGTSCGTSTCVGTTATGHICDGAGTCAPNATTNCDPFLCAASGDGGAGAGCTTSCAVDADCASDAWCSGTLCKKKETGSKQSCSANDQCTTNICVDGFCCNAPCTGICEACNVAGGEGTCVPVSNAPVMGHGTCPAAAGGNPCTAAQCDGTQRTTCGGFVGSSVSCRAAGCVGGVQTLAASCDAHGNCPAVVTKTCAPYVCDGATACKTSCASTADCAMGATCSNGQCVSGATCTNDHTSQPADMSTPQDCTPYKCDTSGTCKQQCANVADCATPNVCDDTGHCVAPPSGTGDSGGCAIAPPNQRSSYAAFLGLALAAFARRRRRTRART